MTLAARGSCCEKEVSPTTKAVLRGKFSSTAQTAWLQVAEEKKPEEKPDMRPVHRTQKDPCKEPVFDRVV